MKLDLAYRHAGVVLCHTCRVTIQDLTLTNARRGTGSALDFFVGDDDVGTAALVLQDVRRHRLVCTPSSSLQDVLEGTPRSKILPPSPTGEQVFALKTVNVQVCLPAGAGRSRAWLGAQSNGSPAGVAVDCTGLAGIDSCPRRVAQVMAVAWRCNISCLCAGAAGRHLSRRAAHD